MGMEEKYIQQFKKGAYEMILLSLIAQKETYGYEILTVLTKTLVSIFVADMPAGHMWIVCIALCQFICQFTRIMFKHKRIRAGIVTAAKFVLSSFIIGKHHFRIFAHRFLLRGTGSDRTLPHSTSGVASTPCCDRSDSDNLHPE
jgi:hypothetical protein